MRLPPAGLRLQSHFRAASLPTTLEALHRRSRRQPRRGAMRRVTELDFDCFEADRFPPQTTGEVPP